jgi:Nuclease-related domain
VTIAPIETPRLANRAERRVYQALIEQLQPNDLVIPGQRVTDHLKDHEIDFVVAIEGAGIVCLEVKGGEVWHDGAGWCQLRGGKHLHIEPVRQAREACFARRFERSRERLYVGLSRARDQLVVCGDPDFVREMGGPDLVRRLNIAPS